jgi:hypothetical protein
MNTSPLPQPENSDDENVQFQIASELLDSLHGPKKKLFTSDMRRKAKYLTDDFTGCIVVVVKNGKVPPRGIYTVENFIIGPADQAGADGQE